MAAGEAQLSDPVCQKTLKPREGPGTLNQDFTHVGNIEHSGRGADGTMLIHDPRILDRHEPSAELHHAGAACHMGGFQRGVLQGGGIAHGLGNGGTVDGGSIGTTGIEIEIGVGLEHFFKFVDQSHGLVRLETIPFESCISL